MLDSLDRTITAINNFFYSGPNESFPLIVILLIGGGILFTCRTRLVQITMLAEACRVIMEKPRNNNSVSSFSALMVSTASRVGTGNVIGVSTALCLGGVGSLFWMWIIAIIGGASAFVESTLAQIYKRRGPDGNCYGGPSYYIEQGLGQRWLGVVFAIFVILLATVGYGTVAAYNVQSAFEVFPFYDPTSPFIIGGTLTLLFAICIFGGGSRLAQVCEVLVPIMGGAYVFVAVVIMLINIADLPHIMKAVLANAFDFQAIFSGFTGSCLMYGLRRGLFSNEAGLGSSPNAAASADVSHPVKQGLVQTLAVYIDTLLICTATAIMCLTSGIAPTKSIAGALFVQMSLDVHLGLFGQIFLVTSLALFAFTTLIGYYYYCEGCLRFIFGHKPGKVFMLCFRLFSATIVMFGAISTMSLVWNLVDLTQALMIVVNIPVIVLLSTPAVRCLEDYRKQSADGKSPVFKSADISLKQKTDYWE